MAHPKQAVGAVYLSYAIALIGWGKVLVVKDVKSWRKF